MRLQEDAAFLGCCYVGERSSPPIPCSKDDSDVRKYTLSSPLHAKDRSAFCHSKDFNDPAT